MLMIILALVLAFVCFKLGVLTVVVSLIAISAKALIIGVLILAIYCLFRWWRNRSAGR